MLFPAIGLSLGPRREKQVEAYSGMLAGSWKMGIKLICFVAEGCLPLQLQLSPGEGARFLVAPGGLSSSKSGETFFSFLLASIPQPQLLGAYTAFHQQCGYHLEIQHHSHST